MSSGVKPHLFKITKARIGTLSSDLCSSQEMGLFDSPFTPSKLRNALRVCVDSAVSLDGIPYSLFKVSFPWWQSALLDFFNRILSWSAVPAMCRRSIVVPVLKRGDASVPTNYRLISLASCCVKLFEHLILHRIGPHISSQLDQCQGGFRWGADVLVSSLVDVLSSRNSTHTFVAFVEIQKAFDTSWVEGTLVRPHEVGVRGQMWHLMCHFLRGTQSQARIDASLSAPWSDTGIAQRRVLSPLLFDLLVDNLPLTFAKSFLVCGLLHLPIVSLTSGVQTIWWSWQIVYMICK